jgi:hypothetical protein
MVQEAPQVLGVQDLYPDLVREYVQLSPCDGDQRDFVLPGGVRFPVCREEEEFLLVGQVQLCHECGAGHGNWVRHPSYVLCACRECFASFSVMRC